MPSPSGGATRTKFTKLNVPMKAKRMQKPMAKAAWSLASERCLETCAKGRVHRVGARVRVVEHEVRDAVVESVAHGALGGHSVFLPLVRRAHSASTIVAMPMPPPMQSVARP